MIAAKYAKSGHDFYRTSAISSVEFLAAMKHDRQVEVLNKVPVDK